MQDGTKLNIDATLKRLLPGLRVHFAHFRGARIGLAHHGLEDLRQRIFQKTRVSLAGFESVTDIPEVGSIMEALGSLGRDPLAQPPCHARMISAFSERRPFPVVNDAVDAANLTALYYRIPAWLVDCRHLFPPLSLVPAVEHQALVTVDGTHPAVGEPFLCDKRGPIVGLQSDQVRGHVTQATSEFIITMIDPGLEGGLDHDRIVRRLTNWMHTLTGAQLVGHSLSS